MSKLRIAWWNSGLAPLGKRRGTVAEIAYAGQIIKFLFQNLGISFLGICETTRQDLIDVCASSGLAELKIFDGAIQTGNLKFDTGAIYNSKIFDQISSSTHIERHGRRKLKLANRLSMKLLPTNDCFHFFLLHWPSNVSPDAKDYRSSYAHNLRCAVESFKRQTSPNDYFVIMGDFNEEPFHKSLEIDLLAVRDRILAQKNDDYFYNPFWRFLGEREPYTLIAKKLRTSGTCRFPRGDFSKWKTVDQILIGNDFLGQSDWHINEEETDIVPLPLGGLQSLPSDIFDHSPIYLTFETV